MRSAASGGGGVSSPGAHGQWLLKATGHHPPGASAPPLLNQEWSPFATLVRRLHLRKMPVYATMYMKNRALIAKSRDFREIVSR